MKVIYGKVKNLQFVDAIIGDLPKLRSQAGITALVSLFSESGGMGAAATLSGINGVPGYYLHFYINDMEFYAAFTGIFFKEDEDVYVVYDEDVEQNFNVLAIMNKNNQLLGMAVPFGHTVAMSDKAHNKTALTMGGITATVIPLLFYYFGARDMQEHIYIYIYIIIFSFALPLFLAHGIKKQFRGYAEESERIYKILGIHDINALNKAITQNNPQPYEDKETNRIYEDVHNYTQFLDYDPQPLVDQKENESYIR